MRARIRPALIDASHHTQLVVARASGRGGLTGSLLGSVSQALLHHADCPVAVVRHAMITPQRLPLPQAASVALPYSGGMAAGSRFHLDQEGHSITVQLTGVSGSIEVLVDGKVVARGSTSGAGETVLYAELPGDPPRPVSITLGNMGGGVSLCEMDVGGTRYLMPRVPLFPERQFRWWTALRPVRRMRRSLWRAVRRATGGGQIRPSR